MESIRVKHGFDKKVPEWNLLEKWLKKYPFHEIRGEGGPQNIKGFVIYKSQAHWWANFKELQHAKPGRFIPLAVALQEARGDTNTAHTDAGGEHAGEGLDSERIARVA